jgi:hypothetical protein
LLLLEATMVIILLPDAVESSLKILSWWDEMRGRDVPNESLEICRHNFKYLKLNKHMYTNIWFY